MSWVADDQAPGPSARGLIVEVSARLTYRGSDGPTQFDPTNQEPESIMMMSALEERQTKIEKLGWIYRLP